MHRPPMLDRGGRRPRRWAVVAVAATWAALAAPAVPPASAALVEGVDLATFLGPPPAFPVPDAPTYLSLSVSNHGTTAATNVSLELSLPPNVQATTNPLGGCTVSPTTVTCELPEVLPNNNVGFDVWLEFAAPGTYQLTSSATAHQPDADGDSTAQIDVVVVDEEADLEGTVNQERVLTGSTVRVGLAFYNNGPTSAGQASLAGSFPTGAALVPGSFAFYDGNVIATSDRCTVSATDYSCGGLYTQDFSAIRQYVSYEVVVPSTPGTVVAAATITGRNDPDPTNNNSVFTINVAAPAAELWAQLEPISHPVPAGEPVPVTAYAANVGELAAADVVATLQAPAGWTVALPAGPDEPGRTCAVEPTGDAVRCTYESIEAGPWPTFTVPLTPPPDVSGTGTVILTLTTPTPESGFLPNTATMDLDHLPAGADLVAVSASHAPAAPVAGEPSTLTFQFENASTDRLAVGVSIAMVFPSGATPVSVDGQTSTGGFLSCGYDPVTRVGSCAPPDGVLAPEAEVVITVGMAYSQGGSFTFTPTVSQTSQEASPGDESISHIVEVEGPPPAEADLRVQAFPSTGEATVGEAYSLLFLITNDGPQSATSVLFTVTTPGVEVVSATVGWFRRPCGVTSDTVSCGLPDLAPGASRFIAVTLRSPTAGPVTSTTGTTLSQVDPDPSSNIASVSVDVVEPGDASPVDLSLSASVPEGPFVVGEPITSVYLVDNNSGRAATNVNVTVASDVGSSVLTVVSAGHGWFSQPCTVTSQITCTIPAITAGGSYFVIVTTNPQSAADFTTTVTATGDQPDPDPTSNTLVISGEAVDPPP